MKLLIYLWLVAVTILGSSLAFGSNDNFSIGFQNIYIQEKDITFAPNILFLKSDTNVKNLFATAKKGQVPGIRADFETTNWMFGFFTSKVTPDDEEFEERAEDSYQIAGIIAKKIGEVRYVSAQMEYAKLDYYMKSLLSQRYSNNFM